MTDKTQPDSGRATGGIVEMLHTRIAELEQDVAHTDSLLGKANALARIRAHRIVELEAQLEAIGAGGVQALSAAPEAFLKSVIALCSHRGYSPANIEACDKNDKWIADLWRQAEAMLAASPTAQAADSVLEDAMAWPKPGPQNPTWTICPKFLEKIMRSSASEYMPGLEEIEAVLLGLRTLFSASRVDLPGWESWPPDAHAADSVLEDAASAGFFLQLPQRPKPEAPAGTIGLDWDASIGAGGVQALSAAPAEQQAAPKAAPGEPDKLMRDCLALLESFDYEDDEDSQSKAFFNAHINADWFFHVKRSIERQLEAKASPMELNESAYQRGYLDGMAKGRREVEAAPQQEAQEPAFWMNEKGHTWSHSDWKQFPKHRAKYPIPLYPHFPAPQPAPDCHHRPPCNECRIAAQGGSKDAG